VESSAPSSTQPRHDDAEFENYVVATATIFIDFTRHKQLSVFVSREWKDKYREKDVSMWPVGRGRTQR
jgi:hypothetical protein